MMITLSDAVDEFIAARRADGKKPLTIKWYVQRLEGLASAYGSESIGMVDTTMMRAYVNALRSRQSRLKGAPQRAEIKGGLSDSTIHGHLRALRAFFSWCIDEYQLSANPMKRISLPKLNLDRPKAASMDDLSRMLACTDESFDGLRARAMLLFLADTGCRLSAMLGLKIVDVELQNHRAIMFEPKVQRSRFAWFSEATEKALSDWLAARQRFKAEVVFVSWYGQPLTMSGVHSVIRRLKSKAGVKSKVNPHAFRHAFAIEYLSNGGDYRSLAMILGHSDVTVTMKFYALWGDGQLEEMHRKFSPIRKLRR